jgi:hypothetical protein
VMVGNLFVINVNVAQLQRIVDSMKALGSQ